MAKASKKAAPVGDETAESIRAQREEINQRIEADKLLVRALSQRLRELEGQIQPKGTTGTSMTIKAAD